MLPSRHSAVRDVIAEAGKQGRTLLTEVESKQILSAYGIHVVESHAARTAEQAVKIAGKLGYPVALKVHSHTITHKSDVDGVSSACAARPRSQRRSMPSKSPLRERRGQKISSVLRCSRWSNDGATR